MASIMRYFKSVPGHLPTGTSHKRGIAGLLVDKGERYGASAAFAFSKTYYADKFIWKGHGADMWLGVGSLAAATLLSIYSGGRSHWCDHLERIGDAGVQSAVSSLAAAYGLQKAGSHVAVVRPAGAKPTAMHGDIVGAISGAKPGPFLTPEQVKNYATRR
ncbi:MAG TPA: hypothetical protein VLV86_10835 [Vicinamibacterales bacterium]|nr:hypothetical protein [Vicinamibacterales bacterium]